MQINSYKRAAVVALFSGLTALPALAALDFYVVVPNPGKLSANAGTSTQEIKVSLSQSSLPVATKGEAYSYDLKQNLSITGDPNLKLSDVTFVAYTEIPQGLSLSTNGVLSGTPTVKAEYGTLLEVSASYKDKFSDAVYTLYINGVALDFKQVSVGSYFACGALVSGDVYCWGNNMSSQLGFLGDNSAFPVKISGIAGATAVATGGDHACALTNTGAVKCWGANNSGQLGNGTTTGSASPVNVPISNVTSLSAGIAHTCAISAGAAYCWGANTYGQVGDGGASNVYSPTPVVGAGAAFKVFAGENHTCAITTSGGAKCWGDDTYGQVGNDTEFFAQPTAVDVAGLQSGVVDLSLGKKHTCAVVSGGAVKCWGANDYNQLGDSSVPFYDYKGVPNNVLSLTAGVLSVDAGENHNCVVISGGSVKCWGSRANAVLGDYAGSSTATPVSPNNLPAGAVQVSAGATNSCAVFSDKRAFCWGNNEFGQVGAGVVSSTLAPSQVAIP